MAIAGSGLASTTRDAHVVIRTMTSEPPRARSGRASANERRPAASRLVRRLHLCLGLFLAPWMVMYALSTLVMNHREWVRSFFPTEAPGMVRERELDYTRTYPADATPQQVGQQILRDLGLEGTHRVSGGQAGKPLIIDRQHAWVPRRITWDATARKLVVERQEFRGVTLLERLHRRRGYQQPYVLEDTWAFSVDLAMVAMVLWSLSGLWLWWELRSARFWGTLCGAAGLILFAVFLALL